MNCDEFRALLDACQENELQAAAKDHAAVCKDCALLLAIRDDCRSLDANAEAPATFSQAWRKMVREEESPLYHPRKPIPRWQKWLSAAAVFVLLIGGTLVVGNDRRSKSAADTARYVETQSFGRVPELESKFLPAPAADQAMRGGGEQLAPVAGIPEESPVEMESEADSGLSGGTETPGSRIIRSVYLSLSSRQFTDDLDRIRTVIKEKSGYVESSDLSADARSRRYASLTARIPSENLDSFLASAKGIGYMTSFSESGEDVSEQYTDTEARLQTQRNKMERLQALLAQADAVEDLLAIETEIANTQYQIDSLTGALQGYDSRINYSAVTIDLAEESMTPSEGSRQRSLWERITDAVRDAFAGMVMFLEDMVVLLAIVLPYIALLAVLATIVAIIVKLVRRKQK